MKNKHKTYRIVEWIPFIGALFEMAYMIYLVYVIYNKKLYPKFIPICCIPEWNILNAIWQAITIMFTIKIFT